MRKTSTSLIAAGTLAAALAVAGCGSAQKAPGVIPAPSAGAVSDTASVTTPTTSSTTSTTSVPTPTSGPLSKEPTIAAGKGAPPKKLVVKNLVTGSGATVAAGDTVTVNYVGALYSNGKVFDASWERHQTFTTPLTGVIQGWQKGLVGMKVGGRRQLIIPPALGYGNQKSGSIPANSTLVFDIDLLKVTKG